MQTIWKICLPIVLALASSPAFAEWRVSGWAQWMGDDSFSDNELRVVVLVSDDDGRPVKGLNLRQIKVDYYDNCENSNSGLCMYVNGNVAPNPDDATFGAGVPGVYELRVKGCCPDTEAGYFTSKPLVVRVFQDIPLGSVVAGGPIPAPVQRAQAFTPMPTYCRKALITGCKRFTRSKR